MIEKEVLEKACAKGRSFAEIAAELSCSKGRVRHWLAKYGLKTKNPRPENHEGEERTCRVCQRHYVFRKEQGHTLEVCNSCLVLKRKYEKKNLLIQELGGSCSVCGYSKCVGALQFHHRDSNKEFSISGNYNRNLKKLVEEAMKCELLCANCHAEIHYGDRIF